MQVVERNMTLILWKEDQLVTKEAEWNGFY